MRILIALLLTMFACTAWSDDLLLTLHVPTRSVPRAAPVTLDLLVLNAGTNAADYESAPILNGTLRSDAGTWVVELRTVQATMPAGQLQPGQFARLAYVLELPADVSGRVVLDIPALPTAHAALDISTTAELPGAATAPPDAASAVPTEPPNVSRIDRAFTAHFAVHEPIYFIYGTEAPAAKFQFSFKYRLTGESARSSANFPALRGLYFAYSQRSLWDVDAESSPFYDTSYMPELFYEWLAPGERGPDAGFHWLGLQTGLQHESNGKSDADTRSMNLAYARVNFVIGPLTGWHVIVAPRAFYYLDVSDRINKYRGNGDLSVALAKNDAAQLSVATRAGSVKGRGSVQVDLTQPINIPWINLHAYAHLQYFDGYGESLLNYDRRTSVWRLGVAFAR